MYVRSRAISAAGMLLLTCQTLLAQTDTNEGGGASNDQQDRFNGLAGRVRALEAWQAKAIEQEEQDIKEELREAELLEASRRKLLELEKRIEALENRQNSSVRPAPKVSNSQENALKLNGTNRRSPADNQIAPGQKGDRWRYQRFQGRWWYWTPKGQWLYWAGDRWMALPTPPASAPVKVADK